jgi:SesB domain on fungal death-pathway protein
MAAYGSDASFGASNQGFQLGQNTGTINMNYGRKSERVARRDYPVRNMCGKRACGKRS